MGLLGAGTRDMIALSVRRGPVGAGEWPKGGPPRASRPSRRAECPPQPLSALKSPMASAHSVINGPRLQPRLGTLAHTPRTAQELGQLVLERLLQDQAGAEAADLLHRRLGRHPATRLFRQLANPRHRCVPINPAA